MTISRRFFLGAGVALFASPAIVKITSIMPVKAYVEPHFARVFEVLMAEHHGVFNVTTIQQMDQPTKDYMPMSLLDPFSPERWYVQDRSFQSQQEATEHIRDQYRMALSPVGMAGIVRWVAAPGCELIIPV